MGTDPFCIEMANSVLNKLVEELDKVAKTSGSDARLVLQWRDNFKVSYLENVTKSIDPTGNLLI